MTGRQRYRQAVLKCRLIGERNLRAFMAGKIEALPCRDEPSFLIEEIERAYRAGLKEGAERIGA